MNDEIRYKAAAAVVALANRAESAGKKDASAAKGAQWQPMPYDAHSKMSVAKLREAVAYYEIAESIDPAAAGWGYPRALLLEAMGDWDQATAAFRGLAGSLYAGMADAAVKRCDDKRAGTYDELASLGLPQELVDSFDDVDADAEPDPEQAAFMASLAGMSPDEMMAAMDEYVRARASGADASGSGPAGEGDQAAAIAVRFVNHLLDRNYAAARAMLHPQDAETGDDDLRTEFEAMFEDEEFPTSANVFDVKDDMPNLGPGGVAWVYVTIDSENAEAVSLVVARHEGELRVRDVEFGRA